MTDKLAELRALLEASSECAVAEEEGRIVYMNPAAELLLGRHEGEPVSDLLPARMLELTPGTDLLLTLGGSRRRARVVPEGDARVYLFSDPPRSSLAAAAPSGAELELNSLLTIMSLGVGSLGRRLTAEGRSELTCRLATMQHSLAQLTRIILGSFSLERMESETEPLPLVSMDISRACRQIVLSLCGTVAMQGVIIEYTGTELVRALSQPQLFRTMVLNLLTCGLERTVTGSHVELKAVSRAGGSYLLMRSTGPQRAWESDTLYSDTAFCHRYMQAAVRAHGGTMTVEEDPDELRIVIKLQPGSAEQLNSPAPLESSSGETDAMIQLSFWLGDEAYSDTFREREKA